MRFSSLNAVGGWRAESYLASLEKIGALAESLLARGMNAQTPIFIMPGNSVDHALLSLAAQYIGVPTVPVAEQYSLIPGAYPRLIEAVQMVRPAMAYVDDADRFAEPIALNVFDKSKLSRPIPALKTSHLSLACSGGTPVLIWMRLLRLLAPIRLPKS
jgi:acyl-CoA synthetase (AMP-forming)/AMP-acid ligase II